MIFAIIDLLEKLLGWLRPFATKEDKPDASEVEVTQTEARSGGSASLFEAVKPDIAPASSMDTNTAGEAPPADNTGDRLFGFLPMGGATLRTMIPELPVITYLKALMADENINKNKTQTAGIYLRGTNTLIFGPVKADTKVWNIIYHYYGNQYTFK